MFVFCFFLLSSGATDMWSHYVVTDTVSIMQGLKSTADEQGTAAHSAVELDDKCKGAAVQVC